MNELIPAPKNTIQKGDFSVSLPAIIVEAGQATSKRFIEFFTASIRNPNTRSAYVRAVRDFFLWCDKNNVGPLIDIEPVHIAAYVETLSARRSAPTAKQHLAAIKKLFDFLVTGGILPANPASSVRGPKHSTQQGKTPVLMADDARALIASMPTDMLIGLRDRAIIAAMMYGFVRVSAALAMDVKDVFEQHHRMHLRLVEKGGKAKTMPCHHNLEEYLREYLAAVDFKRGPLFRAFEGNTGVMSDRRFNRQRCLDMIKRRAKAAGINTPGICNHTFRGTGITAYLSNPDARLEYAQYMADHADPKTTRMYDRRNDVITLDEVEKIGI